MKYDNLKAFEKHLKGAKPQHFADVYVILSKDGYASKEAAHVLLSHLLPQERDLALQTFDGSRLDAQEILLELASTSFFVPKKVIWIQIADKLKKNVQEALESYMAHPQQGIHLILTAGSILKSSTFYKKIEKAGVILEIIELKPWEKEKHLIEWVSHQATAARKGISHNVCQLFVKYCGIDQTLLEQELEKLFCYIGDKKEVMAQDVEAICTHLHTRTIWQLGEAILRHDAATALSIGYSLLQEGQALLPFLRQIRSQLQTGFHICTVLAHEDGQIAEITQEYPYLKGQILERNVQMARQYGLEKFKKGLLAIDEAEMQAKNSQIEDQLLAELLLLKLSSP